MLKSTSNKLNSPNLMVKIACSLVRGYKLLLSPWLGMSCRYTPTCSEYMIDALRSQGLIKGLYTGFKRIGRCHPWGGEGYDPVKPSVNKNHLHKK